MREFERGPKAGDYDYHGACVPKHSVSPYRNDTFSVGVFRYVKAKDGGLKRSPAIVRIRGNVTEAEHVYAEAESICKWLDLVGDWAGPKSMNWDKAESWLQAQRVEHGRKAAETLGQRIEAFLDEHLPGEGSLDERLDSRFSSSCGTVCGKE